MMNPYNLQGKINMLITFKLVGSVPYGLPCIALTRRTLDTTMKVAHIERINEKICKIIRAPNEYVEINDNSDNNNWFTNSFQSILELL